MLEQEKGKPIKPEGDLNKDGILHIANDWYLIEATKGSYFTGNMTMEQSSEEDYNLLTGDYTIRKTDEQGKTKTTKGNRGKKQLMKLKDFNPESSSSL